MIENLTDYSNKTKEDLESQIIFITGNHKKNNLEGGPGSGKGTQCEKLVKNFKFRHLSVGDLMRQEKKKGSDIWAKIQEYVTSGGLVPTELVIEVLGKAIDLKEKNLQYLVDGFPRELDQALVFEQMLTRIHTIVQYECSEEVILSRVLGRMESTPVHLRRDDDKPEVIKDRVNTYFTKSKKATDFYLKLGKVKEVDAVGDPATVFERTKIALMPSLYCIVGATAMGKTELARRLACHAHYNYINVKQFFKVNNVTTCEEKVKVLGEFMNAAPHKNFVLDGFPETRKQAKIYVETYSKPLALFNIKAHKDEVYNRIDDISGENKEKSERLKSDFETYLSLKDELEGYVSSLDVYQQLDGTQSLDLMFQSILKKINPHLLLAVTFENQELADSVLAKLEKEQNYINIDYKLFIENERKRSVNISPSSPEPDNETFLSMFRRIFYSQARQNRKYILSNIPNNFELVRTLEKDVCQFEKMLYFTKAEGGDSKNQSGNFNSEWTDIVGYYHANDMLVQIGSDNIDLVNFHIERRTRYGVIVGQMGTGKTKIARKLKKDGIVKLIKLEKYKEKLVNRLSTDDEPVDEVTNEQAFHHLRLDLLKTPMDQITLLDDFPFHEGRFQKIVDSLGSPLFILRLDASDETVLSRYKKKMDVEELSEEDQELINASAQINDEVNTVISELLKTNPNLTVYDIDVNIPEMSTLETVSKIFRKRIFLTRNINKDYDETSLRNKLGFLCARHGYQFISIEDIYKELDFNDPVQVKDPHYIVNIIKRIAQSNKNFSRNILLYNYLKADGEDGQSRDFYPNSKDEVFFIQHHIGAIRSCFDFVPDLQQLTVEQILEEKKIEEEPVKKPKGEDDEDEDEDEDEEEEGKKKFNPDEYQWYKIDGKPKTFPQFYNMMRPTHKVNIQYTNSNFENLEKCFRSIHEEMEDGQDKYYYTQAVPFEPPVVEEEKQNEDVGNDGGEEDWIAAARNVFDRIDNNESGELSVVELGTALHAAGYLIPAEKIAEVIEMYDKDESGTMGFDEFLKFLDEFRGA